MRRESERLELMKLRLATWNIRKCIGLDRRRDPHRTARVIAGLSADIVALQEADKRLGRRPAALSEELIETETGLRAIDAGGHEPSVGWHGNAVLLSDRVRLERRYNLHLPGIEPRGALIVEVRAGDVPLRVVAVHLGFLRRYRRSQLALIRTRLDAMPKRPTAVLGDFNEWSGARGLEPLQGFAVHAPGPVSMPRGPWRRLTGSPWQTACGWSKRPWSARAKRASHRTTCRFGRIPR